MFELDFFINEYVTKRPESMFGKDVEDNKEELSLKIKNKTVLVIGGAGSIGSSFIKAILPFEPAMLVVVDTNENMLTELTRDLRSTNGMFVPEKYVTYPMDFASIVFEKMFRKHEGFDIVGNFSAHKHVRSEKDIYSIESLIRNNVINAKKLLDLLSEYPPEEYFCVSTDKAANPVNIMGASKRIMEDVIFSYSEKFPVKTARFANVAFSNGSLPAGFLERIRKLQPLSAPSDVKRYFVSPEESGQICMLSCMLGKNREIFFPKLQESQMMTFDIIAEELLHESGYEVLYCNSNDEAVEKAEELRRGSKQYPVYFSGSNTSGEKEFEEFYTEEEEVDMYRLKALGVVTGKKNPDKYSIEILFGKLEKAFANTDVCKQDVIDILKEYLPDFEHIETGVSLDSKM
ncbi:MAG: polysaccharide biosynthesis protein [Dorea sp.]|nr:polysaccharide biosynthesis protein [Dorea sp.]